VAGLPASTGWCGSCSCRFSCRLSEHLELQGQHEGTKQPPRAEKRATDHQTANREGNAFGLQSPSFTPAERAEKSHPAHLHPHSRSSLSSALSPCKMKGYYEFSEWDNTRGTARTCTALQGIHSESNFHPN